MERKHSLSSSIFQANTSLSLRDFIIKGYSDTFSQLFFLSPFYFMTPVVTSRNRLNCDGKRDSSLKDIPKIKQIKINMNIQNLSVYFQPVG